MAQRRMVSIKIIDSAKFIKMPVSTQALYFHLLARADDDGVVEAFNVMRMTGASEDDLKVLTAKDFVVVLNEDLVSYISDWHEHNLIRADRKVDSIYQQLLLQIVGDAEIKEKRQRADRKRIEEDGQRTSQGQPSDSIGKVSLGNDSIGNGSLAEDKEVKDIKKPSVKKTTFSDDSNEISICNYLLLKILNNNENFKKPNLQTWAKEVDKMIRLDKRSLDDIRLVIDFATSDSFWKANILSTSKLREKFDQLIIKAKQPSKQNIQEMSVKDRMQQKMNSKAMQDFLKGDMI